MGERWGYCIGSNIKNVPACCFEEDWDIFVVGKAWNKLMLQQLTMQQKYMCKKGMGVQLLTILHLMHWNIFLIFEVFRLFLLIQYFFYFLSFFKNICTFMGLLIQLYCQEELVSPGYVASTQCSAVDIWEFLSFKIIDIAIEHMCTIWFERIRGNRCLRPKSSLMILQK